MFYLINGCKVSSDKPLSRKAIAKYNVIKNIKLKFKEYQN